MTIAVFDRALFPQGAGFIIIGDKRERASIREMSQIANSDRGRYLQAGQEEVQRVMDVILDIAREKGDYHAES